MGTSDNHDTKSGDGQKYHGNRNNGNDTPKKGQGKNQGKSYEKFKGDEPALNGKIYYVGDYKQTDSYTTTTEAIMNYIRTKYKRGDELIEALKKETHKEWSTPELIYQDNDPESKKEAAKIKYKYELDKLDKDKRQYDENRSNAYGLIFGQCTKALRAKIQRKDNFESTIENDPIELMKVLREMMYNTYQEKKNPVETVILPWQNWWTSSKTRMKA